MNMLLHFVSKLALATAATVVLTVSAFAEMQTLTQDLRFRPTWAENTGSIS
jgi:hypothetical protein